ncbi:MAG: hypothetical protein QOI11_3733 [Candidatus Eremiobacteraeota bacterium]|nr:hypothetical protein [Candidatus Eremiobacteraeota bacterium]
MARKRSAILTDGELRLMEVVWRLGRGTVGEVLEALPEPRPSYSTVLTMLRILERKGYLAHDGSARAYVYRPLVAREDAARHAVGHLVQSFFAGSPVALALSLVESDKPSDEELQRLRVLIDRYEDTP